jgi:hypothetical protein
MFLKVLAILRRLRPAQPLNGVLVVVPANKFAPGARKELQTLAEQMRDRLEEVANTLEFQVPVYVLVSQCDRMGGFEELFHPLRASAVERDKLLGFTLPSDLARHADPRAIELECEQRMARLVRSLETYTVKRVREEWPREESNPIADNQVVRATALAGFVPRFRGVADGVNELVRTLVGGDIRPPILRGVFFSSATQTEANVAGELVGSLGRATADVEKATALPFFVRSLFAALLEGDAHIAHESPEAERARARRSRRVALGIGGVAVAAGTVLGLLCMRANSHLADIQMVAAAARRASDGRRPPKRFDHQAEIATVVGSLVDGVPLGIAPEARDALATTIRESVVAPILSALSEDPARLPRPCEHLKAVVRVGAEAPPSLGEKSRTAVSADLARLWTNGLSGETGGEAFVRRAFELYLSAAEKTPSLWGPPYPETTIDDCCKRLAAASESGDGPWEQINREFGKRTLDLPPGLVLVDDKKALSLQYTRKARAKFIDAVNRQAGAFAKGADPVCATTVTSTETQIREYDEDYARRWTDFLQALSWKDPESVSPTELQSMIGQLEAWRKDVQAVVSAGDRSKQAILKNVPVPAALTGAAKDLSEVENPTLSGFLDLLEQGSALRDRLSDLDKHAAEISAAPGDRAKIIERLTADRLAAVALGKGYPNLVQEVFATGERRMNGRLAELDKANAHSSWCAFIGEYSKTYKRKYPFGPGADDAKPKEVGQWLDKFALRAFEKALPAASHDTLKNLAYRLEIARRGLGNSLDGESAKFVKVTLGNTSAPTKRLAMKWGGQELWCAGMCLPAAAMGRMRLPVSAISFEMRDANGASVDMTANQWTSDYALVHLVEALGRTHSLVGHGARDLTISARVDLDPRFDDSVSALLGLGKDLDVLDRAVACDDVAK